MSASIQSAQATPPVLAPRNLERKNAPAKSLRLPVAVTILSALLALGLGLAGSLHLKQQKLEFAAASSAKADAQARLNNEILEQGALSDAQPNYAKLRANGVFMGETRMEFIEVLNSLKQQFQLTQLEYSIEPQRPLVLADGKNYAAIEILASRVVFTAQADHDAELLGFVGAFADLNRGLFPLQQCRIARSVPPARERFSARTGDGVGSSAPTAANTTAGAATLTARCALDWITLRDKLSPQLNTANSANTSGGDGNGKSNANASPQLPPQVPR